MGKSEGVSNHRVGKAGGLPFALLIDTDAVSAGLFGE
jgi:hypothetical protein